MGGLCITGVTLFHTVAKASPSQTIADDILAISALLFLLCTCGTFWSLRSRHPVIAVRLEKTADVMFAIALTGMVIAGFVMVFTVW